MRRPSPLPAIAGGAPESELQKSVEHKKKITLKKTVGVVREKGGTESELHKGTLELVRTMEGPKLQTETIGLKTTPNGGGNYVEIPIKDLREALDDLDPPTSESS